MIQHYGKTQFIDLREKHHSVKCKPEHIKVISGEASQHEIALDIERNRTGKMVVKL